MCLALLLAFLDAIDPVSLTTELEASAARTGQDVRWVVRLQWQGAPQDVVLQGIPQPETENLRVVGVTRVARRVMDPSGARTVLEIGYVMRPSRQGLARIDPVPFVFDVAGARRVLRAEPVRFDVVAEDPETNRWWIWLACGTGLAIAAAGVGTIRRLRKPKVMLQDDGMSPEPRDINHLALDELVRRAGRMGIAIPSEILEANAAYKFAHEAPDPEHLTRLRDLITKGVSIGRH